MLIEIVKENDRLRLLISVENTKEEVDICEEKDIKSLFARIINMG